MKHNLNTIQNLKNILTKLNLIQHKARCIREHHTAPKIKGEKFSWLTAFKFGVVTSDINEKYANIPAQMQSSILLWILLKFLQTFYTNYY